MAWLVLFIIYFPGLPDAAVSVLQCLKINCKSQFFSSTCQAGVGTEVEMDTCGDCGGVQPPGLLSLTFQALISG